MKRFHKIVLLLVVTALAWSCGNSEPATPLDTLRAYSIAAKKKDTAMMKRLLSAASLKIHREQAKAQNESIDEIIKRETLFPESQRVFKHKNEKIEGDKATVEVQNDFGSWDMVFLVKEDGLWKIDKKGFSDQIIDQNEEAERKLDEQINRERQESENEPDQNENSNVNSNAENTNTSDDPTPKPDPVDPASSPDVTPPDVQNDPSNNN